MAIINPLTYTIANGNPVDATPIQANFMQIVQDVNANAASVNGNASQQFLVATTSNLAGAVPLAQAQQQFAALNGSANNQFAVANATASSQAVNLGQANGLIVGELQSNACNISAAGGTADAITGSYTPGITALTNGMTLYVRAGSANTTTTPTFTPASGTIPAKTIVKGNGLALAVGDIAGAGHWIELQYDQTLDEWVLLNPATGVTTGVIIASTADAQAGTDNTKLITPLRMREGFNAAGSAPVYACRAWVNFNGSGAAVIRASGNVSSVTRNGTGDYTINFATAMADVNYCWQGSGMMAGGDATSGGQSFNGRSDFPPTTTSLRGYWKQGNQASASDSAQVNVAIFR